MVKNLPQRGCSTSQIRLSREFSMCRNFPAVRVGLSLTIVALLATDLHAWFDGDAERKNPLPEAAALAPATKLAKELYGPDYDNAKTPAEKRRLAGKVLAKAGELGNDLPGRYVLLRLSCKIATQAGDADTAFL